MINKKCKLKINTSQLHFIGYSVGLSSTTVIVRVPHYTNLDKFMKNNNSYNCSSINTFVIIESHNYFFIGVIEKEDMSSHDVRTLISDDKENYINKMEDNDETPELYIKILSEINPVNLKLITSTWHFPVIGSKVYLSDDKITKKFIDHVTNSRANCKTRDFSQLVQKYNIKVNFSFNDLFSKHLAIVGSTGSGKSYTAAKLILNLVKQGQHVILLDPTGEYKDIVNCMIKEDKRSVLSFTLGKDTKIPYYNLDNSELYKLIRPSSGIQFPKLKDAIKDLKFVKLCHSKKLHLKNLISDEEFIDNDNVINFNEKETNDIYLLRKDINSLDLSSIGYNFAKLPQQLKEESYATNKSGGTYLTDKEWGYCASLADRINSNLNTLSKYFCNSFDPSKKFNHSIKFQKSLKFKKIVNHKLLYINLEHITLNDYVAEVIGDYIARKLLTSFIKDSDRKTPAVLFLDEAHNFIKKDDVNDDYNLHYFDLIAKEGRKYGLFMTLITQSPYDLSRDVLTQFGTFIIHHLGNGKEREQITSALPYNSNLDKYISSLNTGEAIISSNDLYSPLMVRIHEPSIPPKSNTPKFK